MSFRIFGFTVVPTRYFDRLEQVEDELIDLQLQSEKDMEDMLEALELAKTTRERWKKHAHELEEKLERRVNESIGLKKEADELRIYVVEAGKQHAMLEAEHEKVMKVLAEAEDRLEAAERELREWRAMGATVQEWSNLLTYDGTKQPEVRKEE